eukprot:5623581-Prymnesium_polylepis.1
MEEGLDVLHDLLVDREGVGQERLVLCAVGEDYGAVLAEPSPISAARTDNTGRFDSTVVNPATVGSSRGQRTRHKDEVPIAKGVACV